jgi:hypothetical protein
MDTESGGGASSPPASELPASGTTTPVQPAPGTDDQTPRPTNTGNGTVGLYTFSNLTTGVAAPGDPSNPSITGTGSPAVATIPVPSNPDFADLDDWVPTMTAGTVTVDGTPFNFSIFDRIAHPPPTTSIDSTAPTSLPNAVSIFQALIPKMKDASDQFLTLVDVLAKLDTTLSDDDSSNGGGGNGGSGGSSSGGSGTREVAQVEGAGVMA